jgi:signal transduction histidine kinase
MAAASSRSWRWLNVFDEVRSLVRPSGSGPSADDDTAVKVDSSELTQHDRTMALAPDQVRTRLEMAQRLETLGRLAGSIAHEFHNMLTVIIGYTEMLSESLDAQDHMRRRLIQEIQQAAGQGSVLTEQLLTFGRRPQAVAQPLDVNVVIANLDRVLRRLLGRRIGVQFHLGERLPLIEADTGEIQQVIMNLVLNARDAMEAGEIHVETAHLTHDPQRGGPCVRLTVADTGRGMDEDVRRHLFDPFFTTKPAGQGTGLGLAIVHDIVHSLGGHIAVASAPAAGSRFDVYLPAKVESASQS